MSGFSNLESLLPELFGDVCPRSIGSVTIHALVGGRTAQRTTGFAPRTEFHVGGGVEGIESIGQFSAAAVPTGVQLGMRFAKEREEMEHTARIVVAAHQCGASDGATILFNQREPAFFGEFLAVVAPKISTVAPRTGTRAAREVHGEGHFVGEFLENDVVVDVFEHGGIDELTDMFVCVFSIFPRHAALTPLAGGTIRKYRREELPPVVDLYFRRFEHSIISACGFFLAVDREVGNALEVADDAGEVVDVVAMAVRALGEIALVDATTFVAERVGDIEREVIAAFHSGHTEQVAILGLREVLFEVAVQGAAAGEVVDVATTVETELLDGVGVFIFYDVEIRVVAVARHVVAVFAVPASMLHTDVLGGNHFAVEEQILRAVLLVVRLDERENALHEVAILLVVADGNAETFGRFDHAVDADGEILAFDVDVAVIEEGQEAAFAHPFQIFVVGHLDFVHQIDDFIEIFHIVTSFARGLLHAAVEVDGEDRFRTGRHTAGSEAVGETVVLDLVAQAAAAGQRVGVVAHVSEERVAFGIHLCGEIGVFLVDDIAVFAQQSHGFDREGEHAFGSLLVEPVHEALLQPAEGLPVRARSVGEAEFSEERFEIVAVVVGNVPEDRLEIACAGGLVDGIDDLLEAVSDHLVDGAVAAGAVHDFIGAEVIVFAIFFLKEVAHVHEKLHCGDGAAEHGADDEHHIDESTAEGFQIGGRCGITANGFRAVEQPRVHGDGSTIVGQRGFVVLIDIMVVEQVEIAVGRFFAIHLFELVAEQTAVQTDKIAFGDFADEGGEVFVLDICVRIEL